MNEIDDARVREAITRHFDASPPSLSEGWADIVAGAERMQSEVRRVDRRGDRRRRLIAAAAIVALLAIPALFMLTNRRAAPAQPQPTPARADWGMIATVRITPDPGASVDGAAERAISALRTRAQERDIAGFEVAKLNRDTLSLRLPAADVRDEVERFVSFARLTIVDGSGGDLASGPSLERIGPQVEALTRPGEPLVYYVDTRGSRSLVTRFPTRQAAQQEADRRNRRRRDNLVIVLPIPARLTILADDRRLLHLVADRTILAGAEIQRVAGDARGLRLTLTPNGAARIHPRRRPPIVVFWTGAQPTILSIGLSVGSDRTLLVAPPRWRGAAAEALATAFAKPNADYRVQVVGLRRYGTRPVQAGEQVTAGKQLSQMLRGWPGKRSSVPFVRVLRADTVLGPRDLVVQDAPDGLVGTIRSDDGGLDFMGECPYEVGLPPIGYCGANMAGGGDPKRVRHPAIVEMAARVAPGVDRVELHTGTGRVIPATVRNGWYLIYADARGPGSNYIRNAKLVAYDAEGQRIAERDLGRPGIVLTP